MFEELEPLDADGLEWRGRLKISDRAPLLFPFHKQIDQFMEDARGDKSIGTTKKGIGPCYATKAFRTGLRVGQLRDWDTFETNLRETATGLESLYGFDVGVEPLVDQYKMYADKLINEHDMIIDGVHYVNDAYNNGKNIITEGANAAMLDMDFGTYPFVTSSSTTIGGICSGLDDLDEIKLGVSYSINGQVLKPGQMPSTIEDLSRVEVNYESMPGWNTSIANCRTFEELPPAAQNYVTRIEDLSGTKISWIG